MDFRMMSRLARPANGIDTDAPWAAHTSDRGDVALPEHLDLVNGRTREILEQRRSTAVPRRRGWLIRRLLLLGDIAGLVMAFAAAHLIAHGTGASEKLGESLVVLPGLILAWLALARAYGLFDRDEERTDHTTTDDFTGIFHATTTLAWAYVACTAAIGAGSPPLDLGVAMWAMTLALVPVTRTAARVSARRQLSYLQNAVIVGAGEIGQVIARKVLGHPEYGINVVGFLDSEPKDRPHELDHLAILGGPDRLAEVVRDFDVERVIVAFSHQSHEQTLGLIRTASDLDVHIDVVPRLFESFGPSMTIHMVEGVPLVSLPPFRATRSQLFVKRALDIAGALTGLILFAPLVAAVAIRLKFDSRGPVFYRADRIGRNGNYFKLLKFRTMKLEHCVGERYGGSEADDEFARLMEDPARRAEFESAHKLVNDPRITRFGTFLRRTSLDELPQLWNVLRGDLSLVGPRPITTVEYHMARAREEEAEALGRTPERPLRGYWEVTDFRPGVTGYWQITGRSQIGYAERVRLDVAYLKSWSLKLDLTILAKTARTLFARRGAF